MATPRKHERETLPQNQPEHVAALRAERHADADLARPLRGDVSHDAVEPDHREEERRARENAEHHHAETAAVERGGDELLERFEIASAFPDRARALRAASPRSSSPRRHWLRSTMENCAAAARALEVVHVNCRPRFGVEAVIAHIADHADDVKQTEVAVHVAELDLFSDRVLVRPITPHQCLADQRDVRRVRAVRSRRKSARAAAECASPQNNRRSPRENPHRAARGVPASAANSLVSSSMVFAVCAAVLDDEAAIRAVAAHRQRVRSADRDRRPATRRRRSSSR